MTDPILYGPGYSTYVRGARLALEEKGVAYSLVEIDFLQGMPEEQLARHPFGKVPAFEHDGFKLYEACAIERYVDEAFPGPALQPEDPRQRARMAQTVSVTDSYVYPPTVGTLVIQRLVVPMMEGTPDEAAIEAALPKVATAMAALEQLLGDQPFLADKPGLRRWWESMKVRDTLVRTEPQLG